MCIQIVANERSASIRALFHRHDYFVYLCMYVLYMKLASALRYTNNLRERCKFNIFTFVFHSIIIVLLKTMIYHKFLYAMEVIIKYKQAAVSQICICIGIRRFFSANKRTYQIFAHMSFTLMKKNSIHLLQLIFLSFFSIGNSKTFFFQTKSFLRLQYNVTIQMQQSKH